MPTDEQREIRRDRGLAAVLIAAGALMAGISLAMLIVREPDQMAQVTQGTTPQGTTSQATTPGTPPLEGTPARAEKMAPPIKDK
jgi:hypothetical protein